LYIHKFTTLNFITGEATVIFISDTNIGHELRTLERKGTISAQLLSAAAPNGEALPQT